MYAPTLRTGAPGELLAERELTAAERRGLDRHLSSLPVESLRHENGEWANRATAQTGARLDESSAG